MMMNRLLPVFPTALIAVVLVSTGVLAGAPTVAEAAKREHTSCNDRELKRKYHRLRGKVQDRYSTRTPGRHIVRDGISRRKPSRCKQIGRGVRTFRRWLAPPKPTVMPHDNTPSTRAIASTPHRAGGRWAIPEYIVMCESGGNYYARNPSGAYGAYQIMPGTARAYGCDLSSPAGQDACAARIYAREGASPWVCG